MIDDTCITCSKCGQYHSIYIACDYFLTAKSENIVVPVMVSVNQLQDDKDARIASLERDHKLMRETLDEVGKRCNNKPPHYSYGDSEGGCWLNGIVDGVNDLARTALQKLEVKDE